MKIDSSPLYVSPAQNAEDNDKSARSEKDPVFPGISQKNQSQSFSRNSVSQRPFRPLTNGSRSISVASRNRREADSTPSSSIQGVKPGNVDSTLSPLNQIDETPVPIGEVATFTIFGTNKALPPNSGYSLRERKERVDAYAGRVKTQIGNIEGGSEAERNVRFLNARPFTTPMGYFSGGLLAAGYDPDQEVLVRFSSYVGKGYPESQTGSYERSYKAWEIAAGVLEHDRPERGGPANFQFMHIAPADQGKVNDLESLGTMLQDHWKEDVAELMQEPSGTLAARSGKADAYSVRATLQSLRADKAAFGQLSPQGQQAINRTLDEAGQVIIPNIYGYPLAGHAFIPYRPYDGNYGNRPNQGLMINLDQGTVSEIHGDEDFANWAQRNRDNLLWSFNDRDRQGGLDAHWHSADEILGNLIGGEHVNYPGYKNLVSDMPIPVRETFNYTRSRGSDYQLRYGNLTAGTDGKDGAGIASGYQAVNTKNAAWADQTEVFGASQQNWKSSRERWGQTFGHIPAIGNGVNIVFGIHDSLYGMTAKDRIGGNVAVTSSGLVLVHEVALEAAGLTLGTSTSVLRPSRPYDLGWKYDAKTSEFVFTRPGRVKSQPRLQRSQRPTGDERAIAPSKGPDRPEQKPGLNESTGMSSGPLGTAQPGSAHLNQGPGTGGTELTPEEAGLRQQELQQLVREKSSPPYPAIPPFRTHEQFLEHKTIIDKGLRLKGGGNEDKAGPPPAKRPRPTSPQPGPSGTQTATPSYFQRATPDTTPSYPLPSHVTSHPGYTNLTPPEILAKWQQPQAVPSGTQTVPRQQPQAVPSGSGMQTVRRQQPPGMQTFSGETVVEALPEFGTYKTSDPQLKRFRRVSLTNNEIRDLDSNNQRLRYIMDVPQENGIMPSLSRRVADTFSNFKKERLESQPALSPFTGTQNGLKNVEIGKIQAVKHAEFKKFFLSKADHTLKTNPQYDIALGFSFRAAEYNPKAADLVKKIRISSSMAEYPLLIRFDRTHSRYEVFDSTNGAVHTYTELDKVADFICGIYEKNQIQGKEGGMLIAEIKPNSKNPNPET